MAERFERDGLTDEGFELYRRVAHLVATTLPTDRSAALLGRMMAAGALGPAEEVFRELVATCGPHPSSTAYTATALMTASAAELAYYFLDAVLGQFQGSEGELLSLAAYLNAGRQPELAVYAFTAAARNKPLATVLKYSAELRKRGHSKSAVDLLVSVVAGRPRDVAALLAELRTAGRDHEVELVLSGLCAGGDASCAGLLDTLMRDGGDSDLRALVRLLSGRPFASLAAIVAGVESVDTAALLVPALLACPDEDQAAYFDPDQAQLSAARRGRLAAILVAAAPNECPESLVSWYAGWADPAAVVWLVGRLGDARVPLDPVLSKVATRRDFPTMREALHRLGAHQLAYRLAGLRSEYGL